MGSVGRRTLCLVFVLGLLSGSEASALSVYDATNEQVPLKVERVGVTSDSYRYRATVTNLGPGPLACSAKCKAPANPAYPRDFTSFDGPQAETYMLLNLSGVYTDEGVVDASLSDPRCVRLVVPEGE